MEMVLQAGDARDWVYTTPLHVNYTIGVLSPTSIDFWPSNAATMDVHLYGMNTIEKYRSLLVFIIAYQCCQSMIYSLHF